MRLTKIEDAKAYLIGTGRPARVCKYWINEGGSINTFDSDEELIEYAENWRLQLTGDDELEG